MGAKLGKGEKRSARVSVPVNALSGVPAHY